MHVTCFLSPLYNYQVLISGTQNPLFSEESAKCIRRFIDRVPYFEAGISGHIVRTYLKNESTSLQEGSWFIPCHQFSSRFRLLHILPGLLLGVFLAEDGRHELGIIDSKHDHWLLPYFGEHVQTQLWWEMGACWGLLRTPRSLHTVPESSDRLLLVPLWSQHAD